MRRNKKEIEQKKVLRTYRLYEKTFNKDKYNKILDIKPQKSYRLVIPNSEKAHPLYTDIRDLLKIIGVTLREQLPLYPYFDNLFCCVRRTEYLRDIDDKEYNKLEPRHKVLLKPVLFSVYDRNNEIMYLNRYILKDEYLRLLKIVETSKREETCYSRDNPEHLRLKNKIKRDNLWPKIDKALGGSRYRYDDDNDLKNNKKNKELVKQYKTDLAEIK